MVSKQTIRTQAVKLGFDLVGFTDAEPVSDTEIARLHTWLDNSFHADMSYMRNNLDKRINPANLLDGAKSVICLALSYKIPNEIKNCDPGCAAVADFALYEDYHSFIKQRLFALADFIKTNTIGNKLKFKACVDSVPLAERSFAARAGLGFIGKNTMLINPRLGSNLFLAELICNVEFEPDAPIDQNCGSCDKCISACPTNALSPDKGLDCNKCISCLTIEHRGDIPLSKQPGIGNCLFGCEKCTSVCPYDVNAPIAGNREIQFNPQRRSIAPETILDWDRNDFDALFKGSTVERLGLDLLKRNAKICVTNKKTL